MKSTVTIYKLPWGTSYHNDRENWHIDRQDGFTYVSDLDGKDAAEEAFHLTNAPTECLDEKQQYILQLADFKGPSLSVGDIVRVAPYIKPSSTSPEYYLCKSFGWEKYEGDVIELLKHLSW